MGFHPFQNFKYYSIFDLNVSIIQISICPKKIIEQKEHFAKAIKIAAIEILKAKLRRWQYVIRKSYYQSLSEGWYYILGEQSSEGLDFGISRMDKKGMEVLK
jgi:hypothetical protein